MPLNNIQYKLLRLFPQDGSPTSYTSLRKTAYELNLDDKNLKENIINLTSAEFIKANLKGFFITPNGISALKNYHELPEESILVNTEDTKGFSPVEGSDLNVKPQLTGIEKDLTTRITSLKRQRKIERIAASLLIPVAFAFGYYFGGIKTTAQKKEIEQQNQVLRNESDRLKMQGFDDSVELSKYKQPLSTPDTSSFLQTDTSALR